MSFRDPRQVTFVTITCILVMQGSANFLFLRGESQKNGYMREKKTSKS